MITVTEVTSKIILATIMMSTKMLMEGQIAVVWCSTDAIAVTEVTNKSIPATKDIVRYSTEE